MTTSVTIPKLSQKQVVAIAAQYDKDRRQQNRELKATCKDKAEYLAKRTDGIETLSTVELDEAIATGAR